MRMCQTNLSSSSTKDLPAGWAKVVSIIINLILILILILTQFFKKWLETPNFVSCPSKNVDYPC